MDAERPAEYRAPRVVEVKHPRQHAGVVVTEAIPMALVERSGRIDRVMRLQRKGSEQRRAVECDAKRFDRVQKRPLRSAELSFVEPGDAIAADIGPFDARGPTADACEVKVVRRVAAARFRGELGNEPWRSEIGDDGITAIDDPLARFGDGS